MKQLIFIHGGMRFFDNDVFCKAIESREYNPLKEKKRRADRIFQKIEDSYQIINPEMPNKNMASYKARKIWFEKVLAYINSDDTVLIGNSLGGQFLLKYISENGFPKKIKQLHLVAAVIDNTDRTPEKQYQGDFEFTVENIVHLEKYCDQIFIYHSTDDDVVPYSQAQKIKSFLPTAQLLTFTDRGHFFKEETFPELLENILG